VVVKPTFLVVLREFSFLKSGGGGGEIKIEIKYKK
jgi:hypothetical protein